MFSMIGTVYKHTQQIYTDKKEEGTHPYCYAVMAVIYSNNSIVVPICLQ